VSRQQSEKVAPLLDVSVARDPESHPNGQNAVRGCYGHPHNLAPAIGAVGRVLIELASTVRTNDHADSVGHDEWLRKWRQL
jgi:hypothetical protein